MRSNIVKKIGAKIYRKVNYNVITYSKFIVSGVKERFHYYFDWKSFNIGFGFGMTSSISGWKYILSFDLGFLSCWFYFVKLK